MTYFKRAVKVGDRPEAVEAERDFDLVRNRAIRTLISWHGIYHLLYPTRIN
jgi:hypothetical protein